MSDDNSHDDDAPHQETPAEINAKRFGRDGDSEYGQPTAFDKAGDALEDAAEAVGDSAEKTARGVVGGLTGVANILIKVTYNLARVPGAIIRNPKPSAVAAVLLGAPAAFMAYMHFTDPETHLAKRDPDYMNKCFTFNQASNMRAPDAEKNTTNILNMLRQFNNKGIKTAERLEKSKTIFCFNMDDTKKPEYWSKTKVLVSPARYPHQLSALFYTQADFNRFWNAAYTHPTKINEFTVESGIVFSRVTRAVRALERVRNFYRAVETTSPRHNNLIAAPWEEYLKENPTHYKTAESFIEVMKKNVGEEQAMETALKTFMTDAEAVNTGDIEYLSRYVRHVSILSRSSSEYIYNRDFSLWGTNYAFVDVDRDRRDDDLIKLNYSNQAIYYKLNTSSFRFSKKEEEYDCSKTDKDGNVIEEKTCTNYVTETVYYNQIPARETATMTLSPDTLVSLANKTGSQFLSTGLAERLVHQLMINSHSQALYAQPYSSEADSLMARIYGEVAQNIPHHVAQPSKQGFGLR